MIKISKNMSLRIITKTVRVVFSKYRQLFGVFIAFEWGRIFESPVDQWEVKYNIQTRPNCNNCFFENFRQITIDSM